MVPMMDEQLRVVTEALSRPALSLLRVKDPERVLTVLLSAFDDDHDSVTVDRLHALVDLVWSDPDGDPESRRDPRDIVAPWLKGTQRWLTRYTDQTNRSDNYRLTAEAEQALTFIRALSRPQVITTGSTVQTLLAVARSAAMMATTDPHEHRLMLQARVQQLRDEVADVEQSLAELNASGKVPHVDDILVANEALRLQDLSEALLRDLRQVRVQVEQEAHRIRRAFADDDRPTGQIVDIYSREMRSILSASREGRGFESAQRLLNDRGLRQQLRHDIDTVQHHPSWQNRPHPERSAFARLLTQIETATGDIFDARTSINTAFSALVRSRDVAYRHVLPQALTRAEAALDRLEAHRGRRGEALALPELARGAGRGLRVELEVDRSALEFPLPAPVGPAPDVDLSGMGKAGGAHYPALYDAVEAALTGADAASIDEVFALLTEEDRRPVDLLGLLALGAAQHPLDPPPPQVVIAARRPDGSLRYTRVPNLVFTRSPRPTPHQTPRVQENR